MAQAMLYPWQTPMWQDWLDQGCYLGQAYLLSGADGIGISEFAMAMAQGILCQSEGLDACQTCVQCHQFSHQTHPDFLSLALLGDKKEISVDQVRALNDQVYRTTHQGGYKVVLIELVEHLNRSAFNALLKTLEEPPANTVMILTSHQSQQLPATLISRCRQIRFSIPPANEVMAWLQQQLPQADTLLLKKALKLNWGLPLSAKTWVESKDFEWESAWQTDIKNLQQQRISVSQQVEKWKKWSKPEVVFDYFYLWTVNYIRAAIYGKKLPYDRNWLIFQKSVLQARQLWQQNVNKDLLLESVCLEWLQCQQTDYQPNRALQPSTIRGDQI